MALLLKRLCSIVATSYLPSFDVDVVDKLQSVVGGVLGFRLAISPLENVKFCLVILPSTPVRCHNTHRECKMGSLEN